MLGEIKISFVEKTIAGGMERRLIYAGGLDVDLIVLTPEQLEDAVKNGVSEQVMNRGYVVLYDNMDIAASIKENVKVGVNQKVISEKEFINLVEDFWFYTVWASKKILQGELWTAKMCIDAYLKNLLLRVMESEALVSGKGDVWHNGRFLEKWAGEDTVIALESCFARYEKNNMIFALLQTAGLFGKLAHSVAESCHYEYPQKAEDYAYELQGDYFVPQSTRLYEESDSAFWDDEHISKYMLKAHLNPDCDNASKKQKAIWNQLYTKESLMKEVGKAGFEKRLFFDDVQGSKYSGLGDTICGVFSKEG